MVVNRLKCSNSAEDAGDANVNAAAPSTPPSIAANPKANGTKAIIHVGLRTQSDYISQIDFGK